LHALALLGKQHEKRATESAQMAKIAELEVVMRSQTDKIVELEVAYTNLKREKDKVTDGYQRLSEKHKALAERAEQDKTKLAEAHVVELAKIHSDFDLETHTYIEYR
jgi:predicted nuclease with TOPRIM domain